MLLFRYLWRKHREKTGYQTILFGHPYLVLSRYDRFSCDTYTWMIVFTYSENQMTTFLLVLITLLYIIKNNQNTITRVKKALRFNACALNLGIRLSLVFTFSSWLSYYYTAYDRWFTWDCCACFCFLLFTYLFRHLFCFFYIAFVLGYATSEWCYYVVYRPDPVFLRGTCIPPALPYWSSERTFKSIVAFHLVSSQVLTCVCMNCMAW